MDEDRFGPLENPKKTIIFVPPSAGKWSVAGLSLLMFFSKKNGLSSPMGASGLDVHNAI
jgi:hypothetical protein